MLLLLSCILIVGAWAGSVDLTDATYEAEMAGKSSFINYAPWCGHCKALAPAWEQLGDEFNNPGASPLIGSVDCTVNKAVCEKHGVSGYPTLKVFTPETGDKGKPYEGGRDLPSLKTYVEENLKSKCSVADPSGCSEKEAEYMNKMKTVSLSEITDALARLNKMKESSMAPALKKWVFQRIAILGDLQASKA